MTTSYTFGDVRVERILEYEGPFLPARTMFPSLGANDLESARSDLEGMGALVSGGDMLILAVQSYLLRTPHHKILVDTCIGNDKNLPRIPQWHQQRSTAYLDNLAKAGIGPDEIDIVLCTHLHVDHVGWNTRLSDGRWVPTFPNARYLFGRTEYEHWQAEHAKKADSIFAESVLPVVEAGKADFVASDAAVGDHVRLRATPGHTPGHVAATIGRAGRDEALLIGDIMHSPLQLRDPDLSPVFDADPVQAAMTRKTILNELADTGMACCTAHFASPSVFRIARHGTGFRCEPTA